MLSDSEEPPRLTRSLARRLGSVEKELPVTPTKKSSLDTISENAVQSESKDNVTDSPMPKKRGGRRTSNLFDEPFANTPEKSTNNSNTPVVTMSARRSTRRNSILDESITGIETPKKLTKENLRQFSVSVTDVAKRQTRQGSVDKSTSSLQMASSVASEDNLVKNTMPVVKLTRLKNRLEETSNKIDIVPERDENSPLRPITRAFSKSPQLNSSNTSKQGDSSEIDDQDIVEKEKLNEKNSVIEVLSSSEDENDSSKDMENQKKIIESRTSVKNKTPLKSSKTTQNKSSNGDTLYPETKITKNVEKTPTNNKMLTEKECSAEDDDDDIIPPTPIAKSNVTAETKIISNPQEDLTKTSTIKKTPNKTPSSSKTENTPKSTPVHLNKSSIQSKTSTSTPQDKLMSPSVRGDKTVMKSTTPISISKTVQSPATKTPISITKDAITKSKLFTTDSLSNKTNLTPTLSSLNLNKSSFVAENDSVISPLQKTPTKGKSPAVKNQSSVEKSEEKTMNSSSLQETPTKGKSPAVKDQSSVEKSMEKSMNSSSLQKTPTKGKSPAVKDQSSVEKSVEKSMNSSSLQKTPTKGKSPAVKDQSSVEKSVEKSMNSSSLQKTPTKGKSPAVKNQSSVEKSEKKTTKSQSNEFPTSWGQSLRRSAQEAEFIDAMGKNDSKSDMVVSANDEKPSSKSRKSLVQYDIDDNSDDENVMGNEKHEFADDEAMEVDDDYDSMDEEERQYLKDNEIEERGIHIGSDDTDEEDDDNDEYERNSFIASENEAESIEDDNLDEMEAKIEAKKKSRHSRRPFEDEDEDNDDDDDDEDVESVVDELPVETKTLVVTDDGTMSDEDTAKIEKSFNNVLGKLNASQKENRIEEEHSSTSEEEEDLVEYYQDTKLKRFSGTSLKKTPVIESVEENAHTSDVDGTEEEDEVVENVNTTITSIMSPSSKSETSMSTKIKRNSTPYRRIDHENPEEKQRRKSVTPYISTPLVVGISHMNESKAVTIDTSVTEYCDTNNISQSSINTPKTKKMQFDEENFDSSFNSNASSSKENAGGKLSVEKRKSDIKTILQTSMNTSKTKKIKYDDEHSDSSINSNALKPDADKDTMKKKIISETMKSKISTDEIKRRCDEILQAKEFAKKLLRQQNKKPKKAKKNKDVKGDDEMPTLIDDIISEEYKKSQIVQAKEFAKKLLQQQNKKPKKAKKNKAAQSADEVSPNATLTDEIFEKMDKELEQDIKLIISEFDEKTIPKKDKKKSSLKTGDSVTIPEEKNSAVYKSKLLSKEFLERLEEPAKPKNSKKVKMPAFSVSQLTRTPETKISKGFKVSPLTPKKVLGFDVTPMTPTTSINRGNMSKQKRKYAEIKEPSYILPKTIWTASGNFHVEDLNTKITVPHSSTDWQITVLEPNQKKIKLGASDTNKSKSVPTYLKVDKSLAAAHNFKNQKLFDAKGAQRVPAKTKITENAISRANKLSK